MPTLSVTAIGLVIGVFVMFRHRPAAQALAWGLIGAWLGFLAGALFGLLVDVTTGSGAWVAIAGHVGAAGGAMLAASRARVATVERG